MIIDFHSHILPGIDDGSRNIETSIKMLKKSKADGVDIMVATPHFYADEDRIEDFLKKRNKAYQKLSEYLTDDMPELCLGAEVAFFDGIDTAKKINDLTINGTNIMLLEMPFRKWTDNDILQVKRLISNRKVGIIIAHLERFLKISGNMPFVNALLELPVLVQINAESLTDWKQSRHLIKMFKQGTAHLLGSDCHGMNHRPPNLMDGRNVIEKKVGTQCLNKMDKRGCKLLGL